MTLTDAHFEAANQIARRLGRFKVLSLGVVIKPPTPVCARCDAHDPAPEMVVIEFGSTANKDSRLYRRLCYDLAACDRRIRAQQLATEIFLEG